MLSAGENLMARFASDAALEAGSSITIENHLLSCHATAKCQVVVTDNRGSIVGGETCAGERIEAAFIGSAIGAKTILSLGFTPDLLKRISTAKSDLHELETKFGEIAKVIERIDQVPIAQKAALKNINSIRIKSVKQKFLLQGGIKYLREELEELEAELEKARAGRIVGRDTIHGGVVVHFPGDVLRIDRDLRLTTFFYEEGEIRSIAD